LDHPVFRQNSHIAYFSAYNDIFKIAYEKIMPHIQLEKQSETADLRQRHVVRQVALPYVAYWQRVPLSANTQAC